MPCSVCVVILLVVTKAIQCLSASPCSVRTKPTNIYIYICILILPSFQFVRRNPIFCNDMYDPTPPGNGIPINTAQ